MAQQRIMVVRNLLLVVPFLAILVGQGVGGIGEWVGRVPHKTGRALRWIMPALVGIAIVGNGWWCMYAAGTIANRQGVVREHELAQMLDRNPTEDYCVSPAIARALQSERPEALPNAKTHCAAGIREAIFYGNDVRHTFRYRLNEPGRIRPLPPGPYDINLDYYIWLRDGARIIIAPANLAIEAGAVAP